VSGAHSEELTVQCKISEWVTDFHEHRVIADQMRGRAAAAILANLNERVRSREPCVDAIHIRTWLIPAMHHPIANLKEALEILQSVDFPLIFSRIFGAPQLALLRRT
jgi:hypothetical protein